MSLLIGLLNIGLYCVVAAIIVYLIIWACSLAGFALPEPVPKLLWLIVLIVAVIGLLGLLAGVGPVYRTF